MKLFKSIVLILVSLLTLTTSCNNRKTYAEYLKDEKKAIDLFIAKNNLEILRDFPANGKFDSNDFYKDPYTGVYFNIIEYGDTTIKPIWREKIFIRFKGLHYFATTDTILYSNFQSTFPEELEYIGPVSSLTQSSYANAGWAVPLTYVGHRGKVKLIVPFESGSSYDQSQYTPTYYEQVEYRFENQW
ncbi:MAG: DUF4827 family protein [Proteiniphilum sp.]|jgi:hypothetical protein|uniref:DUF4827 family protein n=1 Tax=Proteiniphilum sp. TaxID=1926877 RepID=UPI000928C3EF|nr:DUF4827 family protein [Proteiniphilum sp.]MEA5128735.1 DUF4827 family protein [Proteiniphilum sp.]OJV83239.1 MAG: hypothetical protein BGO34_16290 [Bacteroidia bacterium 44-10]